MNELMIETKGLTKAFGSFTAVDNVDIKVEKGTIHGFIGPNGAGKTTTIKMLVGSIRPTKGTGFIKGHRIGSFEARKLIGYTPEQPKFYGNMSAFDYVVYMGRISGMGKKDAESRASELLSWLELGGFVHKKVGGFSAGMKQRLGLVQALIHNPELLILDEPTANLDPSGRLSIINKLKSLSKEKGITVFVSSHILSELEKMVDFVTLLDKGRVVIEGDVKSLKRKLAAPGLESIYLKVVEGKG